MEGIMTLRVSALELFQMFCEQLQQDVFAYCGRVLSLDEIKTGFQYEKDLALNETHPLIAKVSLLAYEPCCSYTLAYETAATKLLVHYEIRSQQGQQIELFYQERKERIEGDMHQTVPNDAIKKQQAGLTFWKRRQFRTLEKAILKKR